MVHTDTIASEYGPVHKQLSHSCHTSRWLRERGTLPDYRIEDVEVFPRE
jgi:hypothetical protein